MTKPQLCYTLKYYTSVILTLMPIYLSVR